MNQDNEPPSDSTDSDSHSETLRDSASVESLELTPPKVADHELIRIVGSGAYGDVWLARNVMGVYRAVKVIYRARFNNDRPYEREFAGIERFEPISRSHESQVNILHIGRAEGCFFYVMELADPVEPVAVPPELSDRTGTAAIITSTESSSRRTKIVPVDPDSYQPRTLRSEFKNRGRLPFDECLEISLGLTKALDHLHANGLVHRDIKPANVIFVGGRPKLADIGLVAETDATMSYVGTEGYIPPEGPGRPQADIYSLGKTIYEISTGRDRNDFPELPTLLMEETERSGLVELNEVILRACEENPADRYSSALSMHEDLVQVQAGKSVRRLHLLERQLRALRRIAAVGIALLCLFGLFWYQAREGTKRVSTEASKLSQQRAEDLLGENRLIESLPWLLQAMNQSQHDKPTVERLQNVFSSALAQSPKPLWDIAEGARWAWFSPEGDHLLLARGNRVIIYDVDSHSEIRHLIHSNNVRTLAFSPTANWVATTTEIENSIVFWNWETGERLFLLEDHRAPSWRRYFFKDGKRFISRTRNSPTGGDGAEVILWNLETRKIERSWDLEATGGNMDLDPEGRYFAVTLDQPGTNGFAGKLLHVYDVNNRERLVDQTYPGGAGTVQFSPDGHWLAIGADIRLIETATWEDKTPRDMIASPWIVRFSPDSTHLAVVSSQGEQQIFELAKLSQTRAPIVRNDRSTWNQMSSVGFSGDSRFLSLADANRNTAHILSAASLSPVVSVMATEIVAWHMQFNPKQPLVLVREEAGKIRVWDYGEALSTPVVSHPSDQFSIVRWHAQRDLLLLAHTNGNVVIRPSLTLDAVPQAVTNLPGIVKKAVFSESGKTLVVVGFSLPDRVFKSWIWKEERGFRPIARQATNWIEGVAFSEDETLCALSSSAAYEIYDVATDELQYRIANRGRERVSKPLLIGENNDWLAAGEFDGMTESLVVWDLSTNEERFRSPQRAAIVDLFRNPDKKILLHQSGSVSVCDPINGDLLHHRAFPSFDSADIRLSPDLTRLARVGADSRIHILSTSDLSGAGPLIIMEAPAGMVRWSPDGTKLVTASLQYSRVWDVDSGEPITAPLLHGNIVKKEALSGFGSSPGFVGFSKNSAHVIAFGSDGGLREWPVQFPAIDHDEMNRIAALYSGQRIIDSSVLEPVPADELIQLSRDPVPRSR